MKMWLVLGLAACGRAPDRLPDPRPLDLAAINALVPESLKADLVFEAAQLEVESDNTRETFAVATPKGWIGERTGPLVVQLDPPTHKLGNFTTLRVGLRYGDVGAVDEPQDWDAVSRNREFAQLSQQWDTIEKDEHSPTDHLLVYSSRVVPPTKGVANPDIDTPRTRYIVYAWWRPGGTTYYTCKVTLDGPAVRAEAAFERACKSITVASKGRPLPDDRAGTAPPPAPSR